MKISVKSTYFLYTGILVLSWFLLSFLYSGKNPIPPTHEDLGYSKKLLFNAVDEMNVPLVRVLLQEHSSIDKQFLSSLLHYILMNKPQHSRLGLMIHILLKSDPDMNLFKGRWTLLHQAVNIKNLDVIRLLLNAGVLVNTLDGEGRTPLHHAALLGFVKAAELLLKHGAYPNIPDERGLTPLHLVAGKSRARWCKQKEYCKIVQLLVKDSASCNMRDHKGKTALHYAAIYGYPEVAKTLLSQGADSLIVDKSYASALHYAAGKIKVMRSDKEEYFKTALTLVKHGAAAVDKADKSRRTCLHYACAKGNAKLVAVLVGMGGNVNALDKDKATPLHYACGKDNIRFMPLKYADHVRSLVQIREHSKIYVHEVKDHSDIVKHLLTHGARQIKDRFGYEPHDYAKKYKHNNITCLLPKN